jgi:3D-(3,5/4)-trihydroxycyclohexane-1,2-dione acylhydrolase (decyclizing)
MQAKSREELGGALRQARANTRTTVICVDVDINQRVPGYESWWDVPVAEVSEMESVQGARAEYAQEKKKERYYL